MINLVERLRSILNDREQFTSYALRIEVSDLSKSFNNTKTDPTTYKYNLDPISYALLTCKRYAEHAIESRLEPIAPKCLG